MAEERFQANNKSNKTIKNITYPCYSINSAEASVKRIDKTEQHPECIGDFLVSDHI